MDLAAQIISTWVSATPERRASGEVFRYQDIEPYDPHLGRLVTDHQLDLDTGVGPIRVTVVSDHVPTAAGKTRHTLELHISPA